MKGEWQKAETGRLGYENSEDAVSWNVFRSLQEAGQLGDNPTVGGLEPAQDLDRSEHPHHHPVAGLITHPVAMAKVSERTTSLLIAEEIIPTEFRNKRIPFKSHRNPPNRPKTDGNG